MTFPKRTQLFRGKNPLCRRAFLFGRPKSTLTTPLGRAETRLEPVGIPPAPDMNNAIIGLSALARDRESPRPPSLPVRLEGRDPSLVAEGQGDVVETLHQAPAGEVVELELPGPLARTDFPLDQIDGDLQARVGLDGVPEGLDGLGRQLHSQQTVLERVAAEDVPESGRDDRFEAEVLQRPHGVLAAGAGAELGPGHQDRDALVGVPVEHEVGVDAPGGEQPVLETGLGDPLEVDGGDDLVGVDVRAPQRSRGAGVRRDFLHVAVLSYRSAGPARRPTTAVAAATAGLTRWVRPPLP